MTSSLSPLSPFYKQVCKEESHQRRIPPANAKQRPRDGGKIKILRPEHRTPTIRAVEQSTASLIKDLTAAIGSDNAKVVENIFKKNSSLMDNLLFCGPERPIHVAAEKASYQMICLLVEYGAKIDPKNSQSHTPLHLAIKNHNIDVAIYLIHNSANVNSADYQEKTPLHFAAKKGLMEIALRLVDYGANKDSKDSIGNTPLHVAAKHGQIEIVKYLVNEGANKDSKNNNNDTPLHVAVKYGQKEVATYLFDEGANSDSKKQRLKNVL